MPPDTDTTKLVHLEFLVRMLLRDLPAKRNWMDPFVEISLRNAVDSKV